MVDPGPVEPTFVENFILAETGDPLVYISPGPGQALVWRSKLIEPEPRPVKLPNYYLTTGRGDYVTPAEDRVLVTRISGGITLPIMPPGAIQASPLTYISPSPGAVLVWKE